MAWIGTSSKVAYVPAQSNGAYSPQATSMGDPTTQQAAVIDGTPVRLVVIAFAAAAGLVALHAAGLRFSVGVSA